MSLLIKGLGDFSTLEIDSILLELLVSVPRIKTKGMDNMKADVGIKSDKATMQVEVPCQYISEPHGRLIDADELIAKLRYYYPSITFGKYNISLKDVVNEVESMIKTAPTIIEAEDNNGR